MRISFTKELIDFVSRMTLSDVAIVFFEEETDLLQIFWGIHSVTPGMKIFCTLLRSAQNLSESYEVTK